MVPPLVELLVDMDLNPGVSSLTKRSSDLLSEKHKNSFIIPGASLTVQPASGSILCLQCGERRVASDIWESSEPVLGSCIHLLVCRTKN